MRRPVSALVVGVFTACVVLTASPPAAASPAPPPDLIANGGFDASNKGASWTCDDDVEFRRISPGNEFTHVAPRDGEEPATPGFTAPAAAPPGPRASLVQTTLVGSPTADTRAECHQDVPVRPGGTYTLSASVSGSIAFVRSDYGATWAGPSPDYQRISHTFTAAPGADTVRISIHGWYGQKSYTVDDVTLAGPESLTRAPVAPLDVISGVVTSRTLRLRWSGSPGATRYRVLRDGVALPPVTGTTYLVTGLTPGLSATYEVQSGNGAGWSEPSEAHTPQVVTAHSSPPPPPRVVGAQYPAGGVLLTVKENETVTDGYYVYLGGVRRGWLYMSRGIVAGLPPGLYTFEVTALNSAGESARSEPVTVAVQPLT